MYSRTWREEVSGKADLRMAASEAGKKTGGDEQCSGKVSGEAFKRASFYGVEEVEHYVSKIDGTQKFLFSLHDGNMVESVLMKYKHGNSVCISSQAGCRMGCRFCASTLLGLSRNLYPSEMLDQIYAIQKATGERVSHLVVMGTGEPFDNFESLCRMIELLCSPEGLNISHRNITVSTCGIVPKIYEFADRNPQVTLAISLHSPNDTMRKELMPIANKYSMDELMKAAKYYTKTNPTGELHLNTAL